MKIIVICTGNTCRSQIAEGLLKSKYPEAEIYSAGTHPEIQVNPYAVQAMDICIKKIIGERIVK